MSETLNEAKQLYDLGFSIIWLHPKSKRPIENKWTSRPRKTWEELKAKFKPNYNVGVRLGSTSKIGEGYLVTIDVDVKSKEARHLKEAHAAVTTFCPNYLLHPIVKSGRGGGSCHIYGLSKEPVKTHKITFSKEKVEVFINGAVGMRAAWEVSVMGEGSQCVLPPSTHPDTGNKYIWQKRIESGADLSFLGVEVKSEKAVIGDASIKEDWDPLDIDIENPLWDLDALTIKAVITGEGYTTDRSELVFSVCQAMVKAGMRPNEIASVLTYKKYALSEVAYRHAGNTTSRKRAAKWILDQCEKKARLWSDPKIQFEVQSVDAFLGEEDAALQKTELVEADDWALKIERKGQAGPPLSTVKNIRLILQNAIGANVFRFNDFSKRNIYGAKPPWNESEVGQELRDIDATNIQSWLSDNYRVEPSLDKIYTSVNQIGSENHFHPVRDYLNGLTWDGVNRIDTWLKDYLGGEAAEPYLSAVSRKVLCAMVARVFRPGIKFDHVLVLEGPQDAGKSTAVKTLGGLDWTLDTTIDFKDKDSVMAMQGRWVVELGELVSLKGADTETMKSFITRSTDRIRKSFGHLHEDYPRQCIFIGTTNNDDYLNDPTGNRRFWPVKTTTTRFDLSALKNTRDQLFAEAVFTWRDLEEPLWLDKSEERIAAKNEQESRSFSDIWEDKISTFLEREKTQENAPKWERFSMLDLFTEPGPLVTSRQGKSEQYRVSAALRRMGYTRKKFKKGAKSTWLWQKAGNF